MILVAFLDDMIYNDFRKHVLMSYKMVSLQHGSNSELRLAQAKAVAQGSANFFDKIKP